MDRKTQHILAQITARLPKHLADNLMMDDPEDQKWDGMNDELRKSKHLTAEAKRAIERAAKTQKREQVVNPVIARQIEEYYAREVGKALQNGDIPNSDADMFLQERAHKLRNHAKN